MQHPPYRHEIWRRSLIYVKYFEIEKINLLKRRKGPSPPLRGQTDGRGLGGGRWTFAKVMLRKRM